MPDGFGDVVEDKPTADVVVIMPGHDEKQVSDYGATAPTATTEELDEYGLPKRRKKWSKRPACSALILLVIGGVIGRFVLCG